MIKHSTSSPIQGTSTMKILKNHIRPVTYMLDDCNNIKVNCINTENSITTIVCTVMVQKSKHSSTTIHGILSLYLICSR